MFSEKIKFSVVVPVYNAEQYLEKCICSVLKQTYDYFELIIVDDGSTDGSKKIYDRFAESDARVFAFKIDNGGAFRAREYGIKKATGDYCLFLDSDDQFREDAFSAIEKAVQTYDADCVIFRWAIVNNGKIQSAKIENKAQYDRNEMLIKVLCDTTYNSMCRKAIKKKLLTSYADDENFYHIRHAEDLFESLRIYFSAGNIVFINDVLYFYNQVESSVMHSFSCKTIKDSFKVRYYILNILNEKKLLDVRQAYVLGCIKILSKQIRQVIDDCHAFKEIDEIFTAMKSDPYCDELLSGFSYKSVSLRDAGIVFLFKQRSAFALVALVVFRKFEKMGSLLIRLMKNIR